TDITNTTNATDITDTTNTTYINILMPILSVTPSTIIDQGSSFDSKSLILEAKETIDSLDALDAIDKVLIEGTADTSTVGAYIISFTLTNTLGFTVNATSTVTVQGSDTVVIGDVAITASSFSVPTYSHALSLTDEEILALAGVKSWHVGTGTDLTNNIVIERQDLVSTLGVYRIAIWVDMLPTTIGLNSNGNLCIIIEIIITDILPTTGEIMNSPSIFELISPVSILSGLLLINYLKKKKQ
ncbi:MAG: DUF5011 domain-containing protein, partial [Oscillospiraceae bacterium]|nr:DUF5011 domain-containing protein [Oscillospiraceae bacterium]